LAKLSASVTVKARLELNWDFIGRVGGVPVTYCHFIVYGLGLPIDGPVTVLLNLFVLAKSIGHNFAVLYRRFVRTMFPLNSNTTLKLRRLRVASVG
jgi:hypothetical protein